MATNSPNHRATLEALGTYQRGGAFKTSAAGLRAALEGEGDRGTVVIIGSLTEDLLLEQIVKRFKTTEPAFIKRLTKGGGALSTWHHRTNLAIALGIIDESEGESLDILKAMRNACAHSRRKIDFSTPELRAVMCLLFDDNSAADLLNVENQYVWRSAFVVAAFYLWQRIRGMSCEAASAAAQKIIDAATAELTEKQPSPRKLRKPRARASDPIPKV